jgi:hypothetical protein
VSHDSDHTAFATFRGVRRPQAATTDAPAPAVGRVPVPPVGVFVSPLEQLVIGDRATLPWRQLKGIDYAEALDAAHEDADGRLPHERGGEA